MLSVCTHELFSSVHLFCWQSSRVAVLSEERGGLLLFLPHVMDWLLPIVADVLLRVLPTAKWTRVRPFPRQRLCFRGCASMLPSLASPTCSARCSSDVPGSPSFTHHRGNLRREFRTCLSRNRTAAPPFRRTGVCVASLFVIAFSSADLQPILPLMWRRARNRSAGLFIPLAVLPTAAWHRTHFCRAFRASCARAFPQELRNSPPCWRSKDLDAPRCSGSLGTGKAGIPLRGPLPPPGKTNFKVKSSILYIWNVNIIYFLLCCILWDVDPCLEGIFFFFFLSKVLKSVALYLFPLISWCLLGLERFSLLGVFEQAFFFFLFCWLFCYVLQSVHPVVFSLPPPPT